MGGEDIGGAIEVIIEIFVNSPFENLSTVCLYHNVEQLLFACGRYDGRLQWRGGRCGSIDLGKERSFGGDAFCI